MLSLLLPRYYVLEKQYWVLALEFGEIETTSYAKLH